MLISTPHFQPILIMSKQATKRSMTLDLNGPSTSSKRARVGGAAAAASLAVSAAPPVLTTPDVQMLKLSSPELAKFLTSSQGGAAAGATPTPGAYLFPKTVTEEQELYAKGFEDALRGMHHGAKSEAPAVTVTTAASPAQQTAIATIEKATAAHRNSLALAAGAEPAPAPPLSVTELPTMPARPSSGASGSSDPAYLLPEGVRVKEEQDDEDNYSSDDDSSSNGKLNGSSLSPIDMESQERIKLERKRLRNRVAASKCRRRKLERISQLDEKVQGLKGENSELAAVVKKLKDAVCNLKQEVMEHVNNGCQIMVSDASAF